MRATVRAPRRVVEAAEIHSTAGIPFVRTGPTEAGNYLSWASGCIFMTIDEAGTAHLPDGDERAVVEEVFATWNDAIAGCSYLRLILDPPIETGGPIGNDGVNRIVFRDEVWCRPATEDMPEMCLPGGAAGLTTVTYVDDTDSSRDGEIVDADVELNGEEFAISDDGFTLGAPSCLSDLANTLTHELGHVMGLDHTCLSPADPAKVDGNGDPVPLCTQTDDPAITLATMYNFQECGETSKASPEADDVDAICTIYPRNEDPGTCAPVGFVPGGCCSSGSGGGGAAAGPLALTAALLALARRRRRSA
jgi:MYXO-CTERM domain-containing protein